MIDTVARIMLDNIEENELEVVGNSMLPAINNGDKVHFTKCAVYEDGDIIVFFYLGEIVVHRQIFVREKVYCKGDNSFKFEIISSSDIIGKVTYILREGRKYDIPEVDSSYVEASKDVGLKYLQLSGDVLNTVRSTEYSMFKKKRDTLAAQKNG